MNAAEAKSLIRTRVQQVWEAIDWTAAPFSLVPTDDNPNPTPPMFYGNKGGEPDAGYYGVCGISGLGGGQVSQNVPGQNKHRYGNQLVVDVYVPQGRAELPGDTVTDAYVKSFRDPPSGIDVDRAYPTEPGKRGNHYLHTFIMEFDYEDYG